MSILPLLSSRKARSAHWGLPEALQPTRRRAPAFAAVPALASLRQDDNRF